MIPGGQKLYQSRLSCSSFHSLLMVKNIMSLIITWQYTYESALRIFTNFFTERPSPRCFLALLFLFQALNCMVTLLCRIFVLCFRLLAMRIGFRAVVVPTSCQFNNLELRISCSSLQVVCCPRSFSLAGEGREGELDSWEKDLRSQFMENDRMDDTDCMQR